MEFHSLSVIRAFEAGSGLENEAGNQKLLIVEDDEQLRFGLRTYLARAGYQVVEASSCAEAETVFRREAPELVILDLQLPDGEGLQLLGRLRQANPEASFFILSGHGTIDVAVRAVKQGAVEFFTKPIPLKDIADALARSGSRKKLEKTSGVRRAPNAFVGESDVMERLYEQVARLRDSNCTVLILGETGTGKSVLARRVHQASSRSTAPFVDLNCASLSKEFMEAELFGHERGAFTGAHAAKAGLLEAADGGTLFLDEIGDIDMSVQPKVLKVLEEKRYRRMGEVRERAADVRLVAATHRDLGAAIANGTFRSDLYYRISTVYLTVPPLRERGDDVLLLADHFLKRIGANVREAPELTAEAKKAIAQHSWPGNVRELRNVIERSFLMSGGGPIRELDLRFDPESQTPAKTAPSSKTLEALERQHIEQALVSSGGRVELAAQALGLARSTLYLKIKQYGLTLSKFQTSVPKTG